ncbi:alpha/beta hydrolase [Naumannella halotolerans]|uniref:Alpha-beta hydrolase superfamily lysophospholipase n=1 Tax=Naumannella halotolerans TaxID=993414 RepID=A0A4R7J4F3_9ACTN|nr:alpha/beta hydrolase [Naumannella halotolerans]TDT31203.1 alpha-beta hydrolase superfamily lysophospholipase [Naumannella halotolerans]
MTNDVQSQPSALEFTGHAGKLAGRRWPSVNPTWIALLCHGYGEHSGRYDAVAERLAADGAAVYALDHAGHGRSDGERVLITDFEDVVDDFARLEWTARAEHPGLPVVLIGHSMGGMIAARYAQRHPDELAAVVLSGPVLGSWAAVDALLGVAEIPDDPIDPQTLSRDPAVGEAYVNDELVWHGPFKRPTVRALATCLETINRSQPISVPALHLHGEDDQLVPAGPSVEAWARLGGRRSEEKLYPGARHEIFNETNKNEVLDDLLSFVRREVAPQG